MASFTVAGLAASSRIPAWADNNEATVPIACLLAQEDEILFVRKNLDPLLGKIGSPTKIWVLDHNSTLWGRAIAELSNVQAYEFIDGIAWHGYAGKPSAMTQVHDVFSQKSAYFTEEGRSANLTSMELPFPIP